MFRSDAYLHRITTFGVWALPILTFTIPSRLEPSTVASLDALAIVKLLILLVVFFGGSAALLARLGDAKTASVLRPLLPFYLYFAWAMLSVLWTPRPAVSIGQAGGLASLLVLASLIALVATRQDRTESLLRMLGQMLLAFSIFVIAVQLLVPDLSGLNRRMMMGGNSGIVHPTAAGANASIGLLICVLCLFVGKYRWALRAALVGGLVHGTVLFYASSRMALLMAAVTVGLVLFLYADNLVRAATISLFAVLLLVIVLVDPSFGSVLDSKSSTVQYITRGQSARQLTKVSGREEMWTKVWREYSKSKWIGHGYFITSEEGKLEVWSQKSNHTAHNIYLQILVSTGVIGLLLFLAAISNLVVKFSRLFRGDRSMQNLAVTLAVVAIWYLGWSLLCVSFMGPVRSESVVFFALIGIAMGRLPSLAGETRKTSRQARTPLLT
ncbi:O-antigen ligase family protein [Stieleria sp. ICT_E10.1]|uniref:O-antigen ligase family protein n=1 Tax=Stieleria sedimenti TaxID=2976331 RepID=UPI00217FC9C8|nr:O-antigen ligase family protein [Stieleria sedimenti]MCS7470942.1 O-antigen ligase family protein [Stieleria sedimenti]